jgi:hypothetical protein
MTHTNDADFLRDLHKALRTTMQRHGWPEHAELYEAEGGIQDVWKNLHVLARSIQADRGEGWPAFVEEAADLFVQRHGGASRETVATLIALAATGAAFPQT